jgi:hypothetical protein
MKVDLSVEEADKEQVEKRLEFMVSADFPWRA